MTTNDPHDFSDHAPELPFDPFAGLPETSEGLLANTPVEDILKRIDALESVEVLKNDKMCAVGANDFKEMYDVIQLCYEKLRWQPARDSFVAVSAVRYEEQIYELREQLKIVAVDAATSSSDLEMIAGLLISLAESLDGLDDPRAKLAVNIIGSIYDFLDVSGRLESSGP